MKTQKPFNYIVLAVLVLLLLNCSQDEEFLNGKRADGKTSLFDEVTEPEVPVDNSGEKIGADGFYLSSTGSGGGVTTGTGDWGSGNPNGEFEPGTLTAGEWSDLENWDFWNELLSNQEYYEDVNRWGLKEIERYGFLVTDDQDRPVANAEISLIIDQVEVWKNKTDSKGKASLWSDLDLGDARAIFRIGNVEEELMGVVKHEDGINELQLNTTIANPRVMDIYFAVDCTGSMTDEIDYLKAELIHVIEQIRLNNAGLEMRFGSVFYRDEGDDYVTRDFDFTTDEGSLIDFIKDQQAMGGGDFPEAVHSALNVAITQNNWNQDASSRILFLLLDAPPHYTQEVISDLEDNLIKAAEDGIKIIPITASGIDKSTEFLMRSFAILTNGTYVFITDDSGVGGDHLEPTIGDYEVEKLNDLLIRLVGENVP